MMEMIGGIANKVDLFTKYLEVMFMEKQYRTDGGFHSENDNVLSHYELHSKLFYPSQANIGQTNTAVSPLAEDVA